MNTRRSQVAFLYIAISTALFFCPAKVAVSSQEDAGIMRSEHYAATGRAMIRMTAAHSGRHLVSTLAVTNDDLRAVGGLPAPRQRSVAGQAGMGR